MPTKRPAVIIDRSEDDALCAGLSGDAAPRAVFNSVGGGAGTGLGGRVGALDDLLRRAYERLGLPPGEQPLLVSEGPAADARDARLQRELQALAPGGSSVRVSPLDGREHVAFVGGSILSSLSTFEDMWIPRAEYAAGPEVILRKCN